jgi:hypothetical protein
MPEAVGSVYRSAEVDIELAPVYDRFTASGGERCLRRRHS